MATCKECLHYDLCEAFEMNGISKVHPLQCGFYKNTADVVEAETVSEQLIRKKAEVSDYWQNEVNSYRGMQGYSSIEHDVDNFLRGYNEAVEDIFAILDGKLQKEETAKCEDCEYLMYSDCYGECSKGYKGIVSPNDGCSKGKRKPQIEV